MDISCILLKVGPTHRPICLAELQKFRFNIISICTEMLIQNTKQIDHNLMIYQIFHNIITNSTFQGLYRDTDSNKPVDFLLGPVLYNIESETECNYL